MNRYQKYKADQLIEAGVAEFLDENFYSKIEVPVQRCIVDGKHKFTRILMERTQDEN